MLYTYNRFLFIQNTHYSTAIDIAIYTEYSIPHRDPSVGVIHEQFYIVQADGMGKGMYSAICMAY